MKPLAILKILIKAILIPFIALFVLSKWNMCDHITFIPEDYRFEAGLTLYMAVLEAVAGFFEYFIEQKQTTVQCIFYDNERKEDSNSKPVVCISSARMDVAIVWCHLVLEGNWKRLKESEIVLDIPTWFSVQPDATGVINQADGKLTWNIAALLPPHDNKKKQRVENRMKLSLIRNTPNANEIDLEPTINRALGKGFLTNGLTIRNVE